MNRRLLIIGIDGGTWKILAPAMTRGFMPELSGLVQSGTSGVLLSTVPAITPAAWSTFQTGLNPGRTGIFDFAYWDRGRKKIGYASSRSLPQTIWEQASNAGRRIGLLNLPMTYPPRPINGCVVTGILTPSLESDFTFPAQLKARLLSAVPEYHIFNLKNATAGSPHLRFEDFVQDMAGIIQNRARAAEFLLTEDDFDIFMVHLQASDIVQHAFWGYLDESGPMHDPEKARYIFENFYRVLDDKIRLLKKVFSSRRQDEFLTVLVSDHGFQSHKKRINLGDWLCREGFLALNPRSAQPPLLKRATRALRVGRILKHFIAEKRIKNIEQKLGLNVEQFDWERSRAFSIGRSGEGFIYILAEDPAEKQTVSGELIAKLKALRDPDGDTLVVQAVHRKEEIYPGNRSQTMPDLTVIPADGYSFTGYYRPGAEIFQMVRPGEDFHIGKHHPEGIIVAAGPGVRSGAEIRAGLVDVGPTLLYYLGIPFGQSFDGRVLDELFTEDFKAQNPVPAVNAAATEDAAQGESPYSPEEEKQLQQRLKDLGYM